MEKEVLITIKSSQTMVGEPEAAQPAELISQGCYEYSDEQQRFAYMESELTGLEGTKTAFTVSPDEVVMDRTGAVTSRMVFRRGKKHHFMYETPYGTLALGMDTHVLEAELGAQGGSMRIEYDLDFENAMLSRNKIHITIREKS